MHLWLAHNKPHLLKELIFAELQTFKKKKYMNQFWQSIFQALITIPGKIHIWTALCRLTPALEFPFLISSVCVITVDTHFFLIFVQNK